MSRIYRIEPSRVVHELILKSFGTYLLRYSTENDDIICRITTTTEEEEQLKSNPYVVLSVRVDEIAYRCPIMNYHLPLIGSNEDEIVAYSLEHYKNTLQDDRSLPELMEECVIQTEDTNWKINSDRFQTGYLPVYQPRDTHLKSEMQCDSSRIGVFQKLLKKNEQEISILKTLSYFHIVTFYGISSEINQSKRLILADHGECLKHKYPEIKYRGDLMSKQLAMIGYQIACGMIYLELKQIVHRDLHAENILIDERQVIRITDFEHAIMGDEQERQWKFKLRRLAPECLPLPLDDEGFVDANEILVNEFSSKSDVWAYGLIFIDLTIESHEHIYPNLPILNDVAEEGAQIIEHVKLNGQIHERPNDCPKNLYNILNKCWEFHRDDRISFRNIRNEMLNLCKSIRK